MLVLKDRLSGAPVMSLQTGSEIAQTERPIIDPRQLNVVAFYCQGPRLTTTPAVLHVDDIREAGGLGFIVDSADVIMSPADLVRLQQVMSFNFTLEGKLVVDDTGHKLGKVRDFTVDLHSFYVTQLHVQPGLLQSLTAAEVLIGRSQILEVSDTKIIVKSPDIRQPTIAKRQSLAHNPFHAPAQPEASHANHDES